MNRPQNTLPTPIAAAAATTTEPLIPRELAKQPVQFEQCTLKV